MDANIAKYLEEKGIEKWSDADVTWANTLSLKGLSVTGKQINLLKAAKTGYLWRVAYAVKLNESLPETERFLSSSTNRKMAEIVVDGEYDEIINFLQQYDDYFECLKKYKNAKTPKDIIEIETKYSTISFEDSEKAKAFDNITWSITGTEKSRKGSAFISAIEKGDDFLVSYIISNNAALPKNEKFISEKTGRKALHKALEKEQDSIFITLLEQKFFQEYGVNDDILRHLSEQKHKIKLKELVEKNIIDINASKQLILKFAMWRKDDFMCLFILNLGSDYDFAISSAGESSIKSMRSALAEFKAQRDEKKKPQENFYEFENRMFEEITPKKIENNKAANLDDTSWEILNDNIIVQCENISITQTELQTVFNFKARNVQTICAVNKNATPAVAISVQNFKDIEDDSVLYEAWQKLKDAGKTPPDFTGNDNFTVHKPSLNSKIKIEAK